MDDMDDFGPSIPWYIWIFIAFTVVMFCVIFVIWCFCLVRYCKIWRQNGGVVVTRTTAYTNTGGPFGFPTNYESHVVVASAPVQNEVQIPMPESTNFSRPANIHAPYQTSSFRPPTSDMNPPTYEKATG